MKSTLLLPLALLLATSGFAQTNPKPAKCKTKQPLPSDAFDKMIVQDITYAIIGESTPTSGVKVDVVKPEITISGAFVPKSTAKYMYDVFSFDFKAGTVDRNVGLLKGFSSFNAGFELKPSFHFIPAWNSAKYGKCKDAQPKTLLLEAQNALADRAQTAAVDSFYASAILRNYHLAKTGVVADPLVPLPAAPTEKQKEILIHLVKKYTNNPALALKPDDGLDVILRVAPAVEWDPADATRIDPDTYKDKIVQDYARYHKAYEGREAAALAKKITNAAEIWTQKSYYWFTVSPFGRTEKLDEYYATPEVKDSYFKAGYRFYYGVAGYANKYVVWPQKVATLLRVGASWSHSNNLAALSSYNYETRSPFYASGTAVTEKAKTGTAYNHEDIRSGAVGQLNLECYVLPLNTLVPGLYLSSSASYGGVYRLPQVVNRGDDKLLVGLEGGVVFNINSRDKDKEKNLLSLLVYVRHKDLTDELRTATATGIEESKSDYEKRNLVLGLRVGIPITLPQRTK
jgi:hypothetical protein